MRAIAFACLFVSVAASVAAGRGKAVTLRNPTRPVWLPKVWWAIGECETGLNVHHSTTDYVGAFGFARSTWAEFRRPTDRHDPHTYPADATTASLWQQWRVAVRVWRRYGFSGWGCYTHGGYLVWMGRA